MAGNESVNVEMSRADFEAWRALRESHAIPEVVGQPMSYIPEERKWGEAPPANPPTIVRLKSPQQIVDKQINNLSAVGAQNYRVGIANPKRSWQAASINGQGAYENAMRNPETLKRRETKIRNVSDDEWAAGAERGADRLVQGTIDRRYKIERAWSNLHPKLSAHLQRIDAMPNATPEQREQRMIANVKGMRSMKGTV